MQEAEVFYQNLSRIANRIFAMPASSVAAERNFSDYGFIVSNRRSRLASKTAIKAVSVFGAHKGWKRRHGQHVDRDEAYKIVVNQLIALYGTLQKQMTAEQLRVRTEEFCRQLNTHHAPDDTDSEDGDDESSGSINNTETDSDPFSDEDDREAPNNMRTSVAPGSAVTNSSGVASLREVSHFAASGSNDSQPGLRKRTTRQDPNEDDDSPPQSPVKGRKQTNPFITFRAD
eukprot:ANDGO_07224.mRNA.1 hypothetical protein